MYCRTTSEVDCLSIKRVFTMREKESCSVFSNIDQTINVRYFSHNTVDMNNVNNARRRKVKAKAIKRVHFSHLVTVHKLPTRRMTGAANG